MSWLSLSNGGETRASSAEHILEEGLTPWLVVSKEAIRVITQRGHQCMGWYSRRKNSHLPLDQCTALGECNEIAVEKLPYSSCLVCSKVEFLCLILVT